MWGDQLTLLPDVDVNEKEVQEHVIKALRNYRSLKVKIENQKEQLEHGVVLFPSLRRANGIVDVSKEDELCVKQVERALRQGLNADERMILEKKYLNPIQASDYEIYTELGVKKGRYYILKKSAIFNLATALGLI